MLIYYSSFDPKQLLLFKERCFKHSFKRKRIYELYQLCKMETFKDVRFCICGCLRTWHNRVGWVETLSSQVRSVLWWCSNSWHLLWCLWVAIGLTAFLIIQPPPWNYPAKHKHQWIQDLLHFTEIAPEEQLMKSRTLWVGKDLKDHLLPTPLSWAGNSDRQAAEQRMN